MIDYNRSSIKMWSRLGSCGAYGAAMNELAAIDKNVVAITADLCFYSGLDRFKKKYPDKFYNIGIAEQNLVGVAGGLASEGFTVFASTYASFATTRALDQVRVAMGYMNMPIKLVGLTSGLSVGILGATHMCIEDMAILRAIPNITILSPADCAETVKATMAAAEYPGPVYLRLTGQMNEPIVYDTDYDYQIGKGIKLMEGKDLTIIATGTMVYKARKVADMLKEDHISCTVIDMHTIKPMDESIIDRECCGKKLVVTIEEHSIIGGLGSAVAEYFAKVPTCPIYMLGLSDSYPHAGEYDYLIAQQGLSTDAIYKKVLKRYRKI